MGKEKTFAEIRGFKRAHFRKRLMERLAVVMDEEERDQVSEDIQNFVNKPILILDDGNSFHFVDVQGTSILALYDWEYECLLTAYHKSWIRQNDEGIWEWVGNSTKQKHTRIRNRIQNSPLGNIIEL